MVWEIEKFGFLFWLERVRISSSLDTRDIEVNRKAGALLTI